MELLTPSAQQKQAVLAVHQWYYGSTDQFFILSGPGGTGKTFLLAHIKKDIEESAKLYAEVADTKEKAKALAVQIVVTATQNDPVSNLINHGFHEAVTIYSYLNLVTKPDNNGDYKLEKGSNFANVMYQLTRTNTIIIIDEVSHLSRQVFNILRDSSARCILMGDAAQLLSVETGDFSVFHPKHNIKSFELTENFRAQSDGLKEMNVKLRQAVFDGTFPPILHNGEDIFLCNDVEFKAAIRHEYTQESGIDHAKILTFQNNTYNGYNNYVRKILELPHHPIEGDALVVNTRYAPKLGPKLTMRPSERIQFLGYEFDDYNIRIFRSENLSGCPGKIDTLMTGIHVKRGALYNLETYAFTLKDPTRRPDILDYLTKVAHANMDKTTNLDMLHNYSNAWHPYYAFKEGVLNYRLPYAENTHKAQGRTYPVVFIDLPDFYTTNDRDMLRRLIYVAFSRASCKVYIRGFSH